MRIAIHQPHYYPWLGYFHKIYNVDLFVVLDEVQFEKGSQMSRNRVLDNNGNIKYLTISIDSTDFLQKKYSEIRTKDNDIWIQKQKNCLNNYFRKSKYKQEVNEVLDGYFSNGFQTVFEWTYESIRLMNQIFGITTPLVLQSQINYPKDSRRSDLVLEICKALGADEYYAGNGASVNYLDRSEFRSNGIEIIFQEFAHPVYHQLNSDCFVPGLSVLDYMYNCGVDASEQLFLR